MPFNIGDAVLRLIGGKRDPREDVLMASLGGGGGGGAGTPTVPSPPNIPVPVPRPDPNTTSTVPEPPAPVPPPPPNSIQQPIPESYKSPPDLADMYIRMLDVNRKASMRDEGLTMIAAGLTPHAEVREQLLGTLAGGGGGEAGISMNDIINLQKMQNEQADAAARKEQLGGLMKQYGLDEATVKYLDLTGQLDEVVSALAKPDTEVVETATGSKKLIDKRTGTTIKELSPGKPRETEYIDNPSGKGGKILVYKDDKTRVTTEDAVTEIQPGPRKIIQIDDPEGGGGKISVYEDDMTRVDTGEQVTETKKPKGPITIETLADGRKQPFQDGLPFGDPVGPETNITPNDVKEWQAVNADNKKRGKPEIPLQDWLESQKKAGAPQVNIGDNGVKYPDPPAGYDYKRDKDGKVVVDENGEVELYAIPGGEAAAKTEAQKKKDIEDAKTAADAASVKTSQRTIVDADIDDAVNIIEQGNKSGLPATGVGDWWSGMPGTDALALRAKLDTIKANVAFDKLQQMRQESKTGAALGPVSDFENRLLQATMGSLDQRQDGPTLQYNLRRISAIANMIVNGVPDGKGGMKKVETQSEVDAALSKIPKGGGGDRGGTKIRRIE